MKKKYLYMSSFFVIGLIFTLVFYYSYRVYDEDVQEMAEQEHTSTVDTVKEQRVNTSMKYIVEEYDGTTGVVTSEERTIPVEIAGMTREELEQYIADYNSAMSDGVVTEGPDYMELISFSNEKIVIRETYPGAEDEEGFFLKIEQDEVVIFHRDKITPYEYTGIQAEVIPEEERQRLTEGYFVADEKELYSILENLSS